MCLHLRRLSSQVPSPWVPNTPRGEVGAGVGGNQDAEFPQTRGLSISILRSAPSPHSDFESQSQNTRVVMTCQRVCVCVVGVCGWWCVCVQVCVCGCCGCVCGVRVCEAVCVVCAWVCVCGCARLCVCVCMGMLCGGGCGCWPVNADGDWFVCN